MKQAIAGLVLILALGACQGQAPEDDNSSIADGRWSPLDYEEVTLPTGRVIPCVIYRTAYAGGISCDWSQK